MAEIGRLPEDFPRKDAEIRPQVLLGGASKNRTYDLVIISDAL